MKLRPMICEICGGAEFVKKNGLLVCIHCDANYPMHIEESDEEKEARILRIARLDDAEKELRMSPPHFDIAEDKFLELVKQYPEWSVGYWGVVRAKYGIKYEFDMYGKIIPSCYKSCYEDFRNDIYFKKAIDLAENDQIKVKYKSEGDRIAQTCIEWREKASKFDYDIFISFKASENGEETRDSREMQNLSTYLTEQGYKVFFSPVSMRSVVGNSNWDAYIFNALEKSKIMILYGSNVEYFTTTWVENEWTRYLRMIECGTKNTDSLIVAYENLDINSLPRQLRKRQAINAGDRMFYITLTKRISEILSQNSVVSIPQKRFAPQIEVADGILKHDKVDFFFDVTIPAALKNGGRIGHTLFISESSALRRIFTKMLVSVTSEIRVVFGEEEPSFIKQMQPGDVAARFSNFTDYRIFLQFDELTFSQKKSSDVMKEALANHCLSITIGRGEGSRVCKIDLAPFDIVAIVPSKDKVNKSYLSHFDNVIDLTDASIKDWLPLEISIMANEKELKFSDACCQMICKKANYKVDLAHQIFKMVNDYYTLYNADKIIDESFIQDILSRLE